MFAAFILSSIFNIYNIIYNIIILFICILYTYILIIYMYIYINFFLCLKIKIIVNYRHIEPIYITQTVF